MVRQMIAALTGILAAAAGPAAGAELDLRVLALFRDRAMVEVNGTQRLLRAGETSPEGVTLVSANAQEAVIEVDGRRDSYPLGQHISGSYLGPDHEPAVVQVWPDRDGTYSAVGSINGFPVRFTVDTGATQVALNANEARRIGIDYRLHGEAGHAATAGGVVRSYGVTLDRVRVGDIELEDVPASVIDGPHPTEVLLGMSFLGRLDISQNGRVMELRTRP